MRARFPLTVLAGIAVLGSAACQSSRLSRGNAIPILGVEMARAAGLRPEELSAATKLYIAKCARCHKFYDPGVYGAEEWTSWMTKMSKKAKLKPEQEELLARFLDGFRVTRDSHRGNKNLEP